MNNNCNLIPAIAMVSTSPSTTAFVEPVTETTSTMI